MSQLTIDQIDYNRRPGGEWVVVGEVIVPEGEFPEQSILDFFEALGAEVVEYEPGVVIVNDAYHRRWIARRRKRDVH